ncbi:6764_t:CDS:2, partial [Dentiscutata erythropus]
FTSKSKVFMDIEQSSVNMPVSSDTALKNIIIQATRTLCDINTKLGMKVENKEASIAQRDQMIANRDAEIAELKIRLNELEKFIQTTMEGSFIVVEGQVCIIINKLIVIVQVLRKILSLPKCQNYVTGENGNVKK